MSGPLATLFHPFAAGALTSPGPRARLLFLDALPGFTLPAGFGRSLLAVQPFRPDYLALARQGWSVVARLEGADPFDATLVLAGRHRGRTERLIAEALERTVAGGLVVIAGAKDDGIGSLRKRLAGLVPLDGQLPKFHGMALWLRRPPDAGAAVAALRGAGSSASSRFAAAPGMFSHDRIDRGSALLAAHLPAQLAGKVADFCAGWGYLSAELAQRAPAITGLDLYEADFEALEAARGNLAGRQGTRFFWHDLEAERVTKRYEWVVTNPPFHRGRKADPGLGQAIIRAAAAALRPGGRLVLVANRQLPYEAELARSFGAVEQLALDGGFKVLSARL